MCVVKLIPELVGELGVLIMDKIGIVDDTPCYEEGGCRDTIYICQEALC